MALINTDKNWNDYVACAETVARGAGFRALRDRILELGAWVSNGSVGHTGIDHARAESAVPNLHAKTGHCGALSHVLGRKSHYWDTLLAELGPDDEVLDLGSGTGLLTLPAARMVKRVWALDISQRMGDYLNAKTRSAELANVEPIVASAVSLPLVDRSVNAAISNYCFHHLDDDAKLVALREVERVLVPGGRLVLGDMMFSLTLGDPRNRAVVGSKVRGLLAKGPGGALRLARNGARYVVGRWEQPATAEWWAAALAETGFTQIEVETLEHEGGIARATKPLRWAR